MSLPIPVPKTWTRRTEAAMAASRRLTIYRNLLNPKCRDESPEGQRARVMRLLWAQAFVEQALALETQGVMGDHAATPRKYLTQAGVQ